MELKLYNTLTRTKEPFRPIDPARVGMYVCGPTVYDFAHIGNARPVIVFDVLFRLLRHIYGAEHVKYVRNITDVDDKINARAAERGIPIRELTEETYANFKQDVAALGCLPPTVEPRATEHIEEMKALIERLRAADFAYVAEDHVLFHVAAMKDYGKLSNRTLDEMMAGARVEVAPYKRDPMDFVLWKPSKAGEPGWPSPLGIKTPGRPGWHIECSAMSWKHLGETFDIHGGGIDLVFPHHENELAQSRCAFHTGVMANVWMHNGFLQVEGEKMSKSLGNFITIRQLRENWCGHPWPGEALRFNMLRTSYRQPLDWTYEGLDESHKILWDWYGKLNNVQQSASVPAKILDALCDDLNTPQGITELHQLAKTGHYSELKTALDFLGLSGERANLARNYVLSAGSGKYTSIGHDLNLDQSQDAANQVVASRRRQHAEFLANIGQSASVLTEDKIEQLVRSRNAARKAKDFKESDRIRDELAAMGVVLKDNKDGTTTWEVAR